MSLSLGRRLMIRAMVYTAAEPIPLFWPMRAFIAHNPLHGLEQLPFEQATAAGRRLFGGRGFLARREYRRYLQQGLVDRNALTAQVERFVAGHPTAAGIDLARWLGVLLTETDVPVMEATGLAGPVDVHAALHDVPTPVTIDTSVREAVRDGLVERMLGDRPLYEALDALYGTTLGAELDERVIRICLDFFDEGQSVLTMPGRERGFFTAWMDLARRNDQMVLRGGEFSATFPPGGGPEDAIAHVMQALRIPEADWPGYFTRELARLRGWAGFIRWRASASHYYWARRYPADLVDYLAIRLVLATNLLRRSTVRSVAGDADALRSVIETRTAEAYLGHELHSGKVLPALAQRVEMALADGRATVTQRLFNEYLAHKRAEESRRQAQRLRSLAECAGGKAALLALDPTQLEQLMRVLSDFEEHEGMLWLRALEARAVDAMLGDIDRSAAAPREKRPFVQAMFCIDTRSERIRRRLESVGDYQTFGIAGFFGVPVSFIELGRGSESHLCPVIVTPKHLVLEISAVGPQEDAPLTALGKALHHLKESVLTPFVTVEAIGLLFGLDMVGKTVAPQVYAGWRRHLHREKPSTRLLLDKLSREQADSIVRAVQRALIIGAIEQEFGVAPERITDDMVRELREAALGHAAETPQSIAALDLDAVRSGAFVERLRNEYRINPAYAQLQMERLGRIGFSLEEQTAFVAQALRSIGLTEGLSRFVLLVGHGSSSENNPYESALDCGACGGNHGLVNARVLAQMANRAEVRQRLAGHGIDLAEDTWFVPALHNTTTDEIRLFDLDLLPPSHLVYLERLRSGLLAASRLCAAERLPLLQPDCCADDPTAAVRAVHRNAVDWSQIRPEWGLAGNAYFVIARRELTRSASLEGRAFLHSYDYRVDRKRRLLENILGGPLVVGQWINMQYYFSTVDNAHYGSGSKVNHNVAGRFGVMSGSLSDLRTGLPAQTVFDKGVPYHVPLRLITLIEAPFGHASAAVENVVAVRRLVLNGWIRLLVVDPEDGRIHLFEDDRWQVVTAPGRADPASQKEAIAS